MPMAPITLNDEETVRLIELYREQENLYNTTCLDYFNRDKQRASLRYICNAMGRNDWTVEQLKSKLRNLRTQYTANLGKIRSAEMSNSVFRPTWKFFPLLDSFLKPFCSSRKNIICMSDQILEGPDDVYSISQSHSQQSEDTSFYVGSEDPPQVMQPSSPSQSGCTSPTPSPWPEEPQVYMAEAVHPGAQLGKRKRDVADEAVDILRDMMETRKTKMARTEGRHSTNGHFCAFIAGELDQLAPEKQRQVRKQIFDLVFKNLQDS